MPKQEHRLERLIRMAKERFDLSLELRLESMMTEGGRPAFMKELTPQEQIERFLDPQLRMETMGKLPAEEAADYFVKTMSLMDKEVNNANPRTNRAVPTVAP